MALRGLLKGVFNTITRRQPVPDRKTFAGSSHLHIKKDEYEVTFITHDGEKYKFKGKEGDSLLDIVEDHGGFDINGFGACEGTLTCSTCHVILKPEDYNRLPNAPCEEETDMLDLAYGTTKTSRLGCQIYMSKELDGLEVTLPKDVFDARQ